MEEDVDDEEDEEVEEDIDLESSSLRKQDEENEKDEGSVLHDSDYSFHSNEEKEPVDNCAMPRTELVVEVEIKEVGCYDEEESAYVAFEELQS